MCFSTERFIVLQKVADEFIEHLKREVGVFKPTSGVSPRIVTASLKMLEDAESKGATFLAGAPGYTSSSSLKPSIL